MDILIPTCRKKDPSLTVTLVWQWNPGGIDDNLMERHLIKFTAFQ
jgi:hypothetical protein